MVIEGQHARVYYSGVNDQSIIVLVFVKREEAAQLVRIELLQGEEE